MSYNPDKPRDERGRWTGGSAASAPGNWRDKPLEDLAPAARVAALTLHAHLSLPPSQRRRAAWSDPSVIDRLSSLVRRWNAAAGLDGAEFRDRYLGDGVDLTTAGDLRAAASGAMRARTSGEMAQAGDRLATAMTAIGVGNWPHFLKAAEAKAVDQNDEASAGEPDRAEGTSSTAPLGKGPQSVSDIRKLVADYEDSRAEDEYDIAWYGDFHEDLKHDLAEYLEAHGLVVRTEVNFIMNGTAKTARADIVAMVPGNPLTLTVIDVKTGPCSRLEAGQEWVYPGIVHGALVSSPDPKITSFGLMPGQLLAPANAVIWFEMYRWTPVSAIKVLPEFPFKWKASSDLFRLYCDNAFDDQ